MPIRYQSRPRSESTGGLFAGRRWRSLVRTVRAEKGLIAALDALDADEQLR